MRSAALAILVIRAVLAVALTVSAALAASPEDDYVAARDAEIAKFKRIEDDNRWDDAVSKAHEQALAGLKARLQTLVGDVAIKGLAVPATINLETLSPGDQGFGTLDGLLFAAADDKTRVIVTTERLFARWLDAHKDWRGDKMANLPHDAAAAIRSEDFYNQAIQTDAAVSGYAELPLPRPAAATLVAAMLAARSQDEAPHAPVEIFVTAMMGGRLFVANTQVKAKFAPIPVCDAVRRKQQKAADVLDAKYRAGGLKDEALADRATAVREEAEKLFLACWRREIGKQAAFAAAVKQAQALLDALPLK